MADLRSFSSASPAAAAQAIESARKRRYAKRCLSALTEAQRKDALAWLRAGRSVHVVAHELSVSGDVILELWVRNLEAQMRRAA